MKKLPCQVDIESSARIPNDMGLFSLMLYSNDLDGKEHLALVAGDVDGREDVLVRVHSECFTGDVLGSHRCDCGPQLQRSMELIAEEGRGVVVYMRQEGRGIGLKQKLRAYALQDLGFDTVDANLMLGHEADERDYCVAAGILIDLGVSSVRLMTNNPEKIEQLGSLGVSVSERVPLETGLRPENAFYLHTKARRMRHELDLNGNLPGGGPPDVTEEAPSDSGSDMHMDRRRPFVTLSYAQSLDGCIAVRRGEAYLLSGHQSMKETHRLRAHHQGIVVGIGTVLADDPRLTVRLVPGEHPRPIVLDSRLRCPEGARLLEHPVPPLIATTETASPEAGERLQALGATVLRLPADREGRVSLPALMEQLQQRGIHRIMVEGGARVITSFLSARLVDHVVLTVAPVLLGGLQAISEYPAERISLPKLEAVRHHHAGKDVVLSGKPVWDA